jgi:hypothetical protein
MSTNEIDETLVAAWRKDKRKDIIHFIDFIAPRT